MGLGELHIGCSCCVGKLLIGEFGQSLCMIDPAPVVFQCLEMDIERIHYTTRIKLICPTCKVVLLSRTSYLCSKKAVHI